MASSIFRPLNNNEPPHPSQPQQGSRLTAHTCTHVCAHTHTHTPMPKASQVSLLYVCVATAFSLHSPTRGFPLKSQQQDA